MQKIFVFSTVFLMFLILIPLVLMAQQTRDEKKIPDYSLNERKDVPLELTWKIEDIYPSLEVWKADRQEVQQLMARVDEAAKGWTSSAQSMLAFEDLLNQIDLKAAKLFAYVSHQGNADMGNQMLQSLRGELQSVFVQFNSKISFIDPDILALGKEKFAEYLKAEPELAPYRFGIEEVLRGREHVLPANEQRLVSLAGLFSGATGRAANMLNDVEVPPVEVVLSDGQKAVLNFATFIRLRASKNAADRSLVMHKFWENNKKFENTLAILLDGALKQHLYNAQVHKFKDCLEARLFGNNIPADVYFQLIRSVRENLAPFHRFLALKQKLLGLGKYRYEDIYASAVKAIDKVYTYAEASKLVSDSLRPLGPAYAEVLKQAFANRWIDIYPNKGKQSGAYSGGVYGVHPYIKLNYNGEYDAVSTLAHELGHALHSHFSNQTQHAATAQYATFLAEVASTFNENLLMPHMLKNEKDDLFKLFILDNYLDQVRGALYRQTLFAEFELAMHRMVEEGKTPTPEWLNRKYLELTREYYGYDKGVCEVGDYIQVEWSRVPHFYLNYYVFQYSTGLIASMALSDMVLKGGREAQARYLEFLKSGGSDHPIAILKKAGVDMTTSAPYEAALRRVDWLVGEMEKIVARLQKKGKL